MKVDQLGFPRSFRISGLLLLLGLSTEAVSLFWVHPIAFIAFFVVGGTLLALGVLLFLYSLVLFPSSSHSPDQQKNSSRAVI
jgi:hypothetical protein